MRKDEQMKNVKTTIKGSILTVEIDLSKDLGPSSSGKTTLVGTTSGNVALAGPGGVQFKLGVNCYKS